MLEGMWWWEWGLCELSCVCACVHDQHEWVCLCVLYHCLNQFEPTFRKMEL